MDYETGTCPNCGGRLYYINYDGDDERYIEQMDICHKITKLVKELSDIS